MSWAYYNGDLTDIWPENDVFDGARATAVMVGINGESTFRVTIKGLEDGAIGKDYGAHLHTGPCGLDSKGAATVSGHYNVSPKNDAGLPTVISDLTEVWLNFKVNSDGNARATATVPFIPVADGARSITFHSKPTTPDGVDAGKAGDKLACLPLDIKKLSSSD